MIPNQWYVVLESKEVKKQPVGVTRMGEKLVFWRDSTGVVHCFRDYCVHRGAALSEGRITEDALVCPFHGLHYDSSGRCTLIPANGKDAPVPDRFRAHVYPTYEDHGFIWIWWGEARESLPPVSFFEDLDVSFAYATIHDPWDAHYSRVIENQLDVMHLPFVHYNTIGRGNRTVVDGPGLEWVTPDLLFVYVYNRIDDGTPARKPHEVPVPDPRGDFKLELLMPNLWQNHISKDVRIVAAFVPVDCEHTLLYLRFYQKFFPIYPFNRWIAWAAMPFNRLIAHQDRRIVVTQEPKPSSLKSDEMLVPGDRAIVAYRRRRAELLAMAREA